MNDRMQQGYRYWLLAPMGEGFAEDFSPELSPQEMLQLGVFGGKYLNDCQNEFPQAWYLNARLSPGRADPKLNFFGVSASLTLAEWRRKGWIHPADPRGWFQWYCRYYLGRRMDEEDRRQIKRWKAMKRHKMAVVNHCMRGDWGCRTRQRQALLHWAYDSRRL